MKRRRVKITGIGPVTPAGVGRGAYWDGLLSGRSFISRFERLGEEFGAFAAGEVKDFNVEDYAPRFTGSSLAARHSLLAVAAAALAIRDAGLTPDVFRSPGSVLMVGTSMMDCEGVTRAVRAVAQHGPGAVITRSLYSASPASISQTIGHALGVAARMMTLQSSCGSGLDAIGQAAEAVAAGEAEFALCGGAEAPLYINPLLEFRAAELTSGNADHPERQCRPFDLWRTTGIVSEGACMVVLEPESSPRPAYAWITGYAYASDHNKGNCSGLATSMRMALTTANRRPRQVDAISAWGPGHRQVDAAEAKILLEVFGEVLREIPVSSIKGAVGNALAAAGAMQVAATALGLKAGVVPPTANWEFPDPACPLNLSRVARHVPHRVAAVNAHGISGSNSTLIMEQC